MEKKYISVSKGFIEKRMNIIFDLEHKMIEAKPYIKQLKNIINITDEEINILENTIEILGNKVEILPMYLYILLIDITLVGIYILLNFMNNKNIKKHTNCKNI